MISQLKTRQVYIGGPLRNKIHRDLDNYKCIAKIIRESGFKPYLPHIETADPEKDIDENLLYQRNMQASKKFYVRGF